MFLIPTSIDKNAFVSDIVKQDYRTAVVFKKYDIDFCCGGKWPLGTVCEMKGLNFTALKDELENSIRTIQLSNFTRFAEWDIDFLTEYIVNIHHQYLKDVLPVMGKHLNHFVEGHKKNHPELEKILKLFNSLVKDIFPHLQQEEEVLFPYIRQIAHAYDGKESYASLLVRTLRKPVEEVMKYEHETIPGVFRELRVVTNNYTPPENACVSHRVAFSMLKELDHDLMQHVFLESKILFPKAITMEQELTRKE